MRKLTFIILSLILLSWSNNLLSQEFVAGKIKVKVKTEKLNLIKKAKLDYNLKGIVKTGIEDLDIVFKNYEATNFKPLFPTNPKFKNRHHAFGLDQWYVVELKGIEKLATQNFKSELDKSNLFEITEYYYAKRIHVLPKNSAEQKTAFNDPRFDEQWHYENTGQTSGTTGADISLTDAWSVETGNNIVIVAIIDGGIDYNHQDLTNAMWVNTHEANGATGVDDDGNGYIDDIYGYNFGDNTGSIASHPHGTHVAGTVGAVNNNGIGVSGIAGGSDINGGVRLMSCQTFGAYNYDGFDVAFVYAADNGAVIAQNSWGYTSPGNYEQSVLDAIDYFIANAGYDAVGNPYGPMQGGIVIFAAGNDNSDAAHYPGYYESVMAVASTNHNDQRSWYSNYGTWVDIAAPGGETNVTEEGVLSTLPSNSYGFYQGTSMACPHVSGVAALIVSQYGEIGFSPNQVWDRLIHTTDYIDDLNSGYEGKLGSGRLNAYNTLQVNDSIPPYPTNDLVVADTGVISITLTWTATGSSADSGTASVYDLRYAELLIDSANFYSATQVTNPPRPSAAGQTETFEVTGLTPGTTYYFAIKTADYFGNTSLISNVVTATTDYAPEISITPTSLYANIDTGQVTVNLTIENIGLGDLIFNFNDFSINSKTTGKNDNSYINFNQKIIKEEKDLRKGHPVIFGQGDDGLDGFGYSWIDSNEPGGPVFDWIDISSTGTAISLGDDSYLEVNLPFLFPFYGLEKASVFISSNGFITFNSNSASSLSNQQLPNATSPNDLIALLWDDLYPGNGGNVYYYGNSDYFIIQYNNVPPYSGSGNYTFQAILYNNGDIKLQYSSITGTVTSSTTGIENADGSDGLQVAFNTLYIEDGLAISISEKPGFITEVTPSSDTLVPGTNVTVSVTLNSTDLSPGDYYDILNITSNDPVTPVLGVPATLHVNGIPEIGTDTLELDFNEAFVNYSDSLYLTVSNIGTDSLFISNVSSDDPAFTININDIIFELAANESKSIPVYFEPSSATNFTGNLIISSNDTSDPNINVSLNGDGILPPQIDISPDSLNVDLFTGDTLTQYITIDNSAGGSDLIWEISTNDFEGSDLQIATLSEGLNNNNKIVNISNEKQYPLAVGDFIELSNSPVPLTCLATDPNTGYIYGQQDRGYNFYRYNPDSNIWETLQSCPVSSGNNGGATYLNGKIYTCYTQNSTQIGVYDITNNSWSTITNNLNLGTANIINDGEYVYMAAGQIFMRFNPSNYVWESLANPSITFEYWGGLNYHNGFIYGHAGNGTNSFAKYEIITNTWHTLNSVPSGAVIGCAIDPVDKIYYTYGSYGGNNWYTFDLINETWSISTIPFFTVFDGGIVHIGLESVSGIYFIQGENGNGFAKFETEPYYNNTWLSTNITSDTLSAGQSQNIEVLFDANGLNGGNYESLLMVSSNDPANSEITVPINMHVTGYPVISISEDTINFGQSFVGISYTDTVIVSNIGTDSLIISDITSDNPDFSVDTSYFGLYPIEKLNLVITYTPTLDEIDSAILSVTSNDTSNVVTPILLIGEAIMPPIIEVTPDTLAASLYTGDILTTSLYISNSTGGSNLSFSISGGNSSQDSTSIQYYSTTGETTYHNFNNVSENIDSLYLIVTLNGDYTSSSEYASLSIEGTDIGRINDIGFPDGTDFIKTYSFSGTDIQNWLSDNQLDVSIINSLEVNPGYGEQLNQVQLVINGEQWLSTSINNGSVNPGDSVEAEITFNATGLYGGEYSSNLKINSNDPLNPEIIVPVELHVTGIPEIVVSNNNIDFGPVFVNYTYTDTITVSNVGTDSLIINNIVSDNPKFGVDTTYFGLYPEESFNIVISYNPTIPEVNSGILSIYSNDSTSLVTDINLSGEGILPPQITVNPDSISVSLFTGDSITRFITVDNTAGGSDLYFNIKTGEVMPASKLQILEQKKSYKDFESSLQKDTEKITTVTSTNDTLVLIIQNTEAWGVNMYDFLLNNFNISASVINSYEISSTDFSQYNLIITVGDESSTYYNEISLNRTKFESFVENGGIVQYQLATHGTDVNIVGNIDAIYGNLETYNTSVNPTHPILEGLPTQLQGNQANHCYFANLSVDAVILTETTNSHMPTTVEYSYGNGVVIATGMTWEFLYDRDYNSKLLLPNSVAYALSLIDRSNWLSVELTTDTIPAGSSIDIPITIDATGLYGGDYNSNINITSNDPVTPEVNIPIHLHVTPIPMISVLPETLNFGTIFTGYSETDTFIISNTGTDTLDVNSIISNNSVYTVDISNFKLAPKKEQAIIVTFTPENAIIENGIISILSNDPDDPVVNLNLTGEGLEPPIINISTDTLYVSANLGEDCSSSFTIENLGLGTLEYNITGDSDNASSYYWESSLESENIDYNWTDIKSIGEVLYLTDDSYETKTLPFNFDFYGEVKNTIYISSNGFISFNSYYVTSYYYQNLPNSSSPNDLIAAYWRDLFPNGDDIYYFANESEAIVQYENLDGNTFQIIVKSDNTIKFQYLSVNGYYSCTGIENSSGTEGLSINYNQDYLTNEMAILIYQNFEIENINPTSGNIDYNENETIHLDFNTSNLQEGTFYKNILINSNDPQKSQVVLHVKLVVTRVNNAPYLANSIPTQNLIKENTYYINLNEYFTDPDGDNLNYSANSSVANIVTLNLLQDTLLSISAINYGSTDISIIANDGYLNANTEFTTNVKNETAIEDIKNSPFTIYPNPSNGIINIKFNNQTNEGYMLEILDLSGKVLIYKIIYNNKPINIESLPKGLKIIKLHVEDKVYIDKLLIN